MQRIHLLSCGACRRQLDVTALGVGDVVQCVCDTVLTVPPPREVQVRGLACSRCGGAIGEGDTTCSYCRAALSAEDRQETLLCPVCAGRLPNGSRHCSGCGVELRVAAIPPLPRDGACPRCEAPLRVQLLDDAEVIECAPDTGCGGIWCDRETFQRLQRNARRAAVSGEATVAEPAPIRPVGAPEGATRQYVPCMSCGDLMQRRQFRIGGRTSGIVLDVCRDHGVWFDENELEQALAVVRARLELGEPMGAPRPLVAGAPAARPSRRGEPRREKGGGGQTGGSLLELLLDGVSEVVGWSLFD